MVQPERTQSPQAGLTTAAHRLAYYRSYTFFFLVLQEKKSKEQPGDVLSAAFDLQISLTLLFFCLFIFFHYEASAELIDFNI